MTDMSRVIEKPKSYDEFVAKCKMKFQEFYSTQKPFIRYFYVTHSSQKRKRKPVRGMFIGFRVHGQLYVGWSLCSPGDRWNKYVGAMHAFDRVTKDPREVSGLRIPERIKTDLNLFMIDCEDRLNRPVKVKE